MLRCFLNVSINYFRQAPIWMGAVKTKFTWNLCSTPQAYAVAKCKLTLTQNLSQGSTAVSTKLTRLLLKTCLVLFCFKKQSFLALPYRGNTVKKKWYRIGKQDLILSPDWGQAKLLIPITSFVCFIHLHYKVCKEGSLSCKLFAGTVKNSFTQGDSESSKKEEVCTNIIVLLLSVVTFKLLALSKIVYQYILQTLLPEALFTNFVILWGNDNMIPSRLLLDHFKVPDMQLPPVYFVGDSVMVLFFLPS